jgi:hypothetical protein
MTFAEQCTSLLEMLVSQAAETDAKPWRGIVPKRRGGMGSIVVSVIRDKKDDTVKVGTTGLAPPTSTATKNGRKEGAI